MIAFMDKLNYVKKFLLIGVVTGILIVSLLITVLFEMEKKVVEAHTRQIGAMYINELKDVLRLMQEHRALVYAFGGDGIDEELILEKRQIIVNKFEAIQQLNDQYDAVLNVAEGWAEIQRDWDALRFDFLSINRERWFQDYTVIINKLLYLLKHVADSTELVLDDSRSRYYLSALVSHEMPRLNEDLGHLRGLGSRALRIRTITDTENVNFIQLHHRAQTYNETILQTFQSFVPNKDGELADLHISVQEAYVETTDFLNFFSAQFLTGFSSTVSSNEYFNKVTQLINTNYDLYEQMTNYLYNELESTKNKLEYWKYLIIISSFLASFFTLYAYLGSYFSLRLSIETLNVETAKIADGNFASRVHLNSNDELSHISEAINKMAESLQVYVNNREIVEKELIKAKEEAEIASKGKSEFIANISHELRTPMNVILGMTDLVLQSKLSPKQADYIMMVKESAGSLLEIINDLLDLTKVESGMMSLKMSKFHLHELIYRIVKFHQLKADSKGIRMTTLIASGVPMYVVGDPLRLQQVLINLISNAIKFTEQGEVKLQVTVLTKNIETIDLKFAVFDTGIGIPKDKMSQLFQSFSQVDNSLTRVYEGTGLGLSISKKLIELMGGLIGVESELGKGSVFHFSIPFTLGSEKKSESENDILLNPDLQLEGKILLVEDKKMNQKLAIALLERRGWNVVAVNNGKEAVELFMKETFDMILMDISMPVMDGIQATMEIRSFEQLEQRKKTPIVAMTANALLGDQEKYLSVGMDNYVSKPIDPEHLYAVVSSYLPEGTRYSLKTGTSSEQFRLIKNQLGNDLEIIEEIITTFLEECPHEISRLQHAISHQDTKSLIEGAHGLKGELGNLGFQKAYNLALELEKVARREQINFQEAEKLVAQLISEINNIKHFFQQENWFELL